MYTLQKPHKDPKSQLAPPPTCCLPKTETTAAPCSITTIHCLKTLARVLNPPTHSTRSSAAPHAFPWHLLTSSQIRPQPHILIYAPHPHKPQATSTTCHTFSSPDRVLISALLRHVFHQVHTSHIDLSLSPSHLTQAKKAMA